MIILSNFVAHFHHLNHEKIKVKKMAVVSETIAHYNSAYPFAIPFIFAVNGFSTVSAISLPKMSDEKEMLPARECEKPLTSRTVVYIESADD